MSVTFVIGDIHGGLRALEQVLERISVVSTDRLIFLGDYVDGWSQSYELIEYLLVLSKKHKCIFLKGNHDTWAADWLKGGEPDPVWLQHGGQATCDSYQSISFETRFKHIAFFDSLLDYYVDSENRMFVHAGFTSLRGPKFEHHASTFYWDRTLWELAVCVDPRISRDSGYFPSRLSIFKEVYIGHTPTSQLGENTPMRACNVWNIDTGAAFRGKLTGINIDTKEFWQSSALIDLYPNERGRN